MTITPVCKKRGSYQEREYVTECLSECTTLQESCIVNAPELFVYSGYRCDLLIAIGDNLVVHKLCCTGFVWRFEHGLGWMQGCGFLVNLGLRVTL